MSINFVDRSQHANHRHVVGESAYMRFITVFYTSALRDLRFWATLQYFLVLSQ